MTQNNSCLFLGIDPGLRKTGWGIVKNQGSSISYVLSGVIQTRSKGDMSQKLLHIFQELEGTIKQHNLQSVAIENTYVNVNYDSSLKLAQARAAAILACARCGYGITEYQAKMVKKRLTGSGNADKEQVSAPAEVDANAEALVEICRRDEEMHALILPRNCSM